MVEFKKGSKKKIFCKNYLRSYDKHILDLNSFRKMKLKFGKKSIDIFHIKKNFFSNNDELLKKQKQILRIYKKQPKRKICKICKRKLQGEFFINHQIKYVICNYCSHINGYHEDTIEFSKSLSFR